MIIGAYQNVLYMPRRSSNQGRSDFALWIIQRRNERGWSQDNLAGRTDSTMSQGYVSSLERDARKPSRDMVRTIVKAFYDGSDPKTYANFEAEAMRAAGFMPELTAENQNSYPPKLQQALNLFSGMPKDIQEPIADLWYVQIKAHHDILEIKRQEARRKPEQSSVLSLEKLSEELSSNDPKTMKPVEQLSTNQEYHAGDEATKIRASLKIMFPEQSDSAIEEKVRGVILELGETDQVKYNE